MGYRSTFITDDKAMAVPQWFVDKWKESVHFGSGLYDQMPYHFPISAKAEYKCYGHWEELMPDLQKILREDKFASEYPDEYCIHLVFLHEDGKLDRYDIWINQVEHVHNW